MEQKEKLLSGSKNADSNVTDNMPKEFCVTNK